MEQDLTAKKRAEIWLDKNLPIKLFDPNDVEYDAELKAMREKIASFENSFVQKHAEMFLTNIESARNLALTPFVVSIRNAVKRYALDYLHSYSPSVFIGEFVLRLLSKLSTDQEKSKPNTGTTEKERQLSKAKILFDGVKEKDDAAITQILRSEILETLQSAPEIMDWCEKLFELTLCSTWTAYEVLGGDLWEDTVNNSFKAASNVINYDPQTNPVDSTKFDLHLLFKHGLNLEDKMGTVLKHKFKFTSVEQIDFAFTACFETRRTSKKQRTAENKNLFGVEQARHLILHKGGVVDERYQRKVSPDLVIGHRLVLSIPELNEAMEEVFNSGCDLILKTEHWLNNQRSKRKG